MFVFVFGPENTIRSPLYHISYQIIPCHTMSCHVISYQDFQPSQHLHCSAPTAPSLSYRQQHSCHLLISSRVPHPPSPLPCFSNHQQLSSFYHLFLLKQGGLACVVCGDTSSGKHYGEKHYENITVGNIMETLQWGTLQRDTLERANIALHNH